MASQAVVEANPEYYENLPVVERTGLVENIVKDKQKQKTMNLTRWAISLALLGVGFMLYRKSKTKKIGLGVMALGGISAGRSVMKHNYRQL